MNAVLSVLGGVVIGLVYGYGVYRTLQGMLQRTTPQRMSAYVQRMLARQAILLGVFWVTVRGFGADPLPTIGGLALGWAISRRVFRHGVQLL